MKNSSQADLCISCGATIDHAHHEHRFGPFAVQCHIEECDACIFMRQFPKAHLLERPYKEPRMRLGPDGKPSKAFYDLLQQAKAKMAEREETNR